MTVVNKHNKSFQVTERLGLEANVCEPEKVLSEYIIKKEIELVLQMVFGIEKGLIQIRGEHYSSN